MQTSPKLIPLSKEPTLIIGTFADQATSSRLRQFITHMTRMFRRGPRGFADPLEQQRFENGPRTRKSVHCDMPSF